MVTKKNSKGPELTAKEIKQIEAWLLEERKKIQQSILAKKENDMPEVEVGDDIDIASQSLDKEVLFELNSSAHANLDQIESALRRISKGIYGICESCRQPIPKKRILAIPFARYCINCQSSNEKIK
ncbi:MAG: TraR/DksA family transcriptional regulator [Elusimicrobiaceae bacterium]|nr:TraR/DksA family transcriptional regulator [Elusimicrobiaceae bacterium]